MTAEEEFADRFYHADAWFALQGELAAWLLSQGRSDDDKMVFEAVKEALESWPLVTQIDLMNTFLYTRHIKSRDLGVKPSQPAPVPF